MPGWREKKFVFSSKGTFVDVKEKLESVYPKLKDAGGFELLRTGSPNAKLFLINPLPFLWDTAGLAYIRPLQMDLDTPSSSVLDLNNQDTKAVADETSLSMLSQIFSEKPKQVIEEAVSRANGNDALAAQEILEEKDMPSDSPGPSSSSLYSTSFVPETSDASNLIHTGIDTISDSELLQSPFDMASTPPAAKVFSTLEELMQGHKRSLGLDEDNVKCIRA
ncbi:uncharacterized protein LOC114971180 [Acropora millepora]|uniref:uncharacterized protein LOC114971180 n=1 Tax=Acropora millepora TaxID=45264 RepID=UPI001CF31BB1|nr:uncharacterized protein LOC114971180 [Acropora millepora]